MKINRREFISSVGALAVVPSVSFANTRDPYLKVGDSPDFLYFEDWTRPLRPSGPFYVEDIGTWNGTSYPVSIRILSFGTEKLFFTGLDTEWSFLRVEVKDFKWNTHDHFPNIHSYVRWKRYNESPENMRNQMKMNTERSTNIFERARVEVRNLMW